MAPMDTQWIKYADCVEVVMQKQKKKHPNCGFCEEMMIRASARVRKKGDERT